MEISAKLITKLQMILDKLELVDGIERTGRLEYGSLATETILCETENKLGITLPPSFRQALKEIGRSLYFYYSLKDFILPVEFEEIFSGGLSWDIEGLEFINEITGEYISEEDDEEYKAYIKQISGLLQFTQSGNGDIYAFDMNAKGPDKPVVYWEHETCDIIYVAENFQSYLEGIIEIYAVGDEIWQLEGFLEADGLNPYNSYAKKWKLFFESLLNTRLEIEKQNLDTLFSYTLVRAKLNNYLKEAYKAYDKKDILKIIQKKLREQNNTDTKKLLITMAAELVGTDAERWVSKLWESITEYPVFPSRNLKMGMYSFSSELLAYLSACCMEQEQTFQLIRNYLLQWAGNKLTGWDGFEHMKFFNRELVIPWMEQQNMTSPSNWDMLFMSVKPRWSDLLRWSKEARLKKVMIDGLALFVEKKEGLLPPDELPDKQTVLDWLADLKETEILNIRKRKIDKIAAQIDLLYA